MHNYPGLYNLVRNKEAMVEEYYRRNHFRMQLVHTKSIRINGTIETIRKAILPCLTYPRAKGHARKELV